MARGGKRPGAGRPSKFGTHSGKTKTIRIPAEHAENVIQFINPNIRIPLFASVAPAGFVSPADDFIETTFTVKELVDYFMQRPAATFLVRIAGWSMKNAGINDGAIVICDRSLEPVDGDVVLASIDGEVTCKRLRISKDLIVLAPENEEFEPIIIPELSDFIIWGVVTGNFNMHRNANSAKPSKKIQARIKSGHSLLPSGKSTAAK